MVPQIKISLPLNYDFVEQADEQTDFLVNI